MAKYDYEIDNKNSFINPFNFVPSDKNKKSDGKRENNDNLLTGVIKCSMHVKTPIAIPDTYKASPISVSVNNKGKIHWKYESIKNTDGKYMIPGSSIRGVVRNVFETATDSCFSTLRENEFLTTRKKPDGNTSAGMLIRDEEGNWHLYEATRYMLKIKKYNPPQNRNRRDNSNERNPEVWNEKICPIYELACNRRYVENGNVRVYSGDRVEFEKLLDRNGREINYINKKGKKCAPVASKMCKYEDGKTYKSEGYFVVGENISNKHHESIFECKDKRVEVSADTLRKAMDSLDVVYEAYNDKSINKNIKDNVTFYNLYKKQKNEIGRIPVWYIYNNGKLYLSLAAIGRIAFSNTLNDLVGEKKPCKTRDEVCEACNLFGMVGDECLGSKLRFTDALCTKEDNKKTYILKELGRPNPSYMPFYSDASKKALTANKNIGYDDGIGIRGRKYYWHAGNCDELNIDITGKDEKTDKDIQRYNRDETRTDRNSTMDTLGNGSEFEFYVYFDEIKKEELDKLIWSINFWDNNPDGGMCHKIGHGKPIGLGSVKMVVDYVQTRAFSDSGYEIKNMEKYEEKDYENEPSLKEPAMGASNDTINALKKISDFNNKKNTRYPHITNPYNLSGGPNDFAAHKWFTKNLEPPKNNKNNKKEDIQILPEIMNNELRLKAYKIVESK